MPAHTTWAQRPLRDTHRAGELRAGAWAGFVPPGDIWGKFAAPPEELWQALADSPNLMRAG